MYIVGEDDLCAASTENADLVNYFNNKYRLHFKCYVVLYILFGVLVMSIETC